MKIEKYVEKSYPFIELHKLRFSKICAKSGGVKCPSLLRSLLVSALHLEALAMPLFSGKAVFKYKSVLLLKQTLHAFLTNIQPTYVICSSIYFGIFTWNVLTLTCNSSI